MTGASPPQITDDHLEKIRKYYASFNERRFADAAALFTDDALVEQVPFQTRERGPAAYLLFADLWTRAFPDARMTIEDLAIRPGGACEVELVKRGTHGGELTLGGCRFKPTGVAATLRCRELLEFRGDRISASCLSFDLQELAHQLARVDERQLLVHLSRLRYLEDQLRAVQGEPSSHRDLLERIGRELDAARMEVRPYFQR